MKVKNDHRNKFFQFQQLERSLKKSGLQGNVWRNVVLRYKKTIFERDRRFFAIIFIVNGFGQC